MGTSCIESTIVDTCDDFLDACSQLHEEGTGDVPCFHIAGTLTLPKDRIDAEHSCALNHVLSYNSNCRLEHFCVHVWAHINSILIHSK